MIFYRDDEMLIRNMQESDAQIITDCEILQGYHASVEKYRMRLRHQREGKSVALVAEYRGQVAGYIHVYWSETTGAFAKTGYPEIVDFGVLQKFRRKGIGNKLMDAAEALAAEASDTVYLGVGLHSGYGSAQRMYIKRGYIPDGSGVWYKDEVCEPYSLCRNDDDLVLYLSKKLK